MQDSPQHIKTRLDRAVDSEGNVLDMAAVLEIVTTLERFPITKEALETTRIGKTINLLRKKTNNDGLAKRAKKLVKKWQTLVINHIQTSRSTDSPLNGSRVSSPQINGAIHNLDKSGTPTLSERTEKPKILEGKKRRAKRKRDGSSSDNSPIMFAQTLQDSSRSNTPRSTYSSSSTPASGPNSNASVHDGVNSGESTAKQTGGLTLEGSNSDSLESGTPINTYTDGTKVSTEKTSANENSLICEKNGKNENDSPTVAMQQNETTSSETTSMEEIHAFKDDLPSNTNEPSETEKDNVPNNQIEKSNVQNTVVDICNTETENKCENIDAPPSKRQKLEKADTVPCEKPDTAPCKKPDAPPCEKPDIAPLEKSDSAPREEVDKAPFEKTDASPEKADTSPCEKADILPCEKADIVPCETDGTAPCEKADIVHCETAGTAPCEKADIVPCETADTAPCKKADLAPCEKADPAPCEKADPAPCEKADLALCKKADLAPCEASLPSTHLTDDNLVDIHSEKEIDTSVISDSTCEKHDLPERGSAILETEQIDTLDEDMDTQSPLEPKELVLDINEQADGVNGRFSDNGQWYGWTEVMPYNEGNLDILPYVLLD